MDSEFKIIETDLENPAHQRDFLSLTAAYALDPMGNGGPLPPDVLARLIPGLRAHPTSLIFLAYQGGDAVGLATCFFGFSTFAALPIINISDFFVLPGCRGRGIGKALLASVEDKARASGCCRVTLEVQEENRNARILYERNGFAQAVYGPETGGSLYYWKRLLFFPCG
jgi:GNAT superfamily N-acetyltransferase